MCGCFKGSFTYLPGVDALLTGHEDGSVRCWQLPSDTSTPVLDKKGRNVTHMIALLNSATV